MKRSDFLKLTLLAPLAGLFSWLPGRGRWRAEFARDVYVSPSGKEFTAEELEIYGVAMEDIPAGRTGKVRLLPRNSDGVVEYVSDPSFPPTGDRLVGYTTIFPVWLK